MEFCQRVFYSPPETVQHNVTQKTFLSNFVIHNFQARFDEFIDLSPKKKAELVFKIDTSSDIDFE